MNQEKVNSYDKTLKNQLPEGKGELRDYRSIGQK